MNSQNVTFERLAYSANSNLEALAAPTNKQLLIHSLSVTNAAATAQAVAISRKLNQYTAQVYENTTTPVLASNPSAPDLTNGLVIACPFRFDFITFSSITGTPALSYWDGSAFTSLTPVVNDASAVLFNAPVQWVAGSSYSGLDSSLFYLRIATATAVSGLKICKMFKYYSALGPGQVLEVNFPERQFLMEQGESVIPYFTTTNAANVIELSYQINP